MDGLRGEKKRPEYKKFVLKTEVGTLTIPTGRSTNHSTKNL
jgi:hypothetical protein